MNCLFPAHAIVEAFFLCAHSRRDSNSLMTGLESVAHPIEPLLYICCMSWDLHLPYTCGVPLPNRRACIYRRLSQQMKPNT